MVNRFVMQWHLSEMCNLRCMHCYQENHIPVQLAYPQLLNILNQYRELLQKLDVKGHINLTGGEPLCSPYFFEILDEFKKDRELYSFSILTNGTLLTEEIAAKISEYEPEYVQISLEGGKKINDYIRGKGVYRKVAKAVRLLRKNGIYVSLSFTATNINYKEFPKVVKFAKRYGVNTVWSDRFIPLSDKDMDLNLDREQTQEYLKLMAEHHVALKKSKHNTEVAMYRALQFQKTCDYPYRCTAGESLLTVMENGDLVPCRRMPIVVGNLLSDNMYELYVNSPELKRLRGDTCPKDCVGCEHEKLCNGGLKCLTYAIYGDLDHRDVGCTLNLSE